MAKRKLRSERRLHPVEEVDLAVARTLALDDRKLPGRWIAHFAELGDQPPLAVLSLATAASGAALRDERLTRTGLRMLTAHALATMAKTLVKDRVDRTRPDEAMDKDYYRLEEGDSREGDLRSMPSGHTAGTVAVAVAALADYPERTIPVTAGAAAVILAQLPSRNHYLSDVAAGIAIGLAAAGVARLLIPRQASINR